jgi:DNA repair protein RadA/Sms
MLVAVLSNRCRLSFPNKDVYLNVAGGLKICEPGVDLAIIAAIISSYYQRPLPARAVFFGEVSLSGDIRQVHLPFNRLKEAKKLGFTEVFCPYKSDLGDAVEGIKIVRLKTIRNLSDIIKRFQRQSCDEKI